MKKQILTLTVCLALTVTTTLAVNAKTVTKKTAVKPVACVTKKTVQAPVVTLTPEQLAKKKFQEKLAKDRDDLYCKLGLTAEQKAKAVALNQQQDAKSEPLITKLCAEKAKLNELKAKNACEDQISQQKKEVKKAKKELKANFKAAQKDFEAILTKDQKSKLDAIKEEHKKCHCKGDCKCKKHKHECPAKDDKTPKEVAPAK